MKLLSVAQMYKMDVVLTHIRNDIARQEPPFIREDTAFLIYSLAQKYGLRTEALQAARWTLSFPCFTIEDLFEEHKLDMMPGASLHELWKYRQRVRSNLALDLEEFGSNALKILGDLICDKPADSGLPAWLDRYISNTSEARAPFFLNLLDFHMRFSEHIQLLSPNDGCKSCSGISRKKIGELWEALTATVHCRIAKVSVIYVSALPNGPEHLYRLRQILRSLLRRWDREARPDRLAKPLLHRSIQICPMQISFSSHPTMSISVSINRRWLRRRPFLLTCFLSHNPRMTLRSTSFPLCVYLKTRKS